MSDLPTRRAVLAAACGALASPVFAQEKSGRVLKLVTTLAAGGALDALARVLAVSLSQSLGRPVIVETKAGGKLVKAGGGSYFPADPEAFRAFLAREIDVTKAGAKAAGIRLE